MNATGPMTCFTRGTLMTIGQNQPIRSGALSAREWAIKLGTKPLTHIRIFDPDADIGAIKTRHYPRKHAAFSCAITGIHRTRSTPDGRKVDRRMLGKASGAAVMLCPMSAVGAGLTLGEGIETCLAAWKIGWSNAWAACSVGAIERFPLLPYVQSLVLLAETDTNGANARAIEAAGRRYAADGREVLIVEPGLRGLAWEAERTATTEHEELWPGRGRTRPPPPGGAGPPTAPGGATGTRW